MPDLQASLKDALAKANQLVPSEAGSIYLHQRNTDELVIVMAFGSSAPSVVHIPIPRTRGFAGFCFAHGPVLANDVRSDARFYDRVDAKSAFQTRSVLCVPLRVEDRTLGVIQLLNRLGEGGEAAGRYVERDQELLEVLAQVITQSISHAAAAARDHLTGLYNSRAFHERLDRILPESRARKEEFCVLFLDLDHFKLVNDRYGHLVGSRAIVAVSQVLRSNTRRSDFIARYGGDEFILILPNTKLEQAVFVAEKLREKVEDSPILDDPDLDLSFLTCSIGCASSERSGDDREMLLRLADGAMYKAKEARNKVERMAEPVADKSIHEAAP